MENTIKNEGRDAGPDEQRIVNQIAREFLAEQRRSRRWNIAFKIFIALYLLLFLVGYFMDKVDTGGSASFGGHTALIDINGVIADATEANADNVNLSLRRAYKDKNTKGIILRINSPGGSPVQAGHIYDEIWRLKQQHPDIPVYAVLGDVCASGGYYIAAAADHIYADKASLVGSIGVIMAGFGFVGAIEKLGIERRLIHAGENKAMLDPFSPLRQEEASHVRGLLEDIYVQFKGAVKRGRGDRLGDEEEIFSGLVWSGERSVELGLVDGLGNSDYVARELIGVEEVVNFSHEEGWFERFADEVGSAFYERFLGSAYFQVW